MALIDTAFAAINDLNLWFKLQDGGDLKLSDVPALIPLRWPYLRDNWNFIKQDLDEKADSAPNPQLLRMTIADFNNFVELQRFSPRYDNPLISESRFVQFKVLFDELSIADINLTNEENDLISARINAVRGFTRTDFLRIVGALEQARDEYVDYIGGADSTYNRIVARADVTTTRTPTPQDIQEMLAFQDGIKACELILSNQNLTPDTGIDPFALAKENANNPDVEIQSHQTGSLVRMQYGDTLQDVAARYYGDPDRWIEIAIANGLRPPYIDEVGTTISLLANAMGNQINLSKNDAHGESNLAKLYINQRIFLHSTSYPFPEQRYIQNIRQIPVSGEIIVELSGDLDLQKYTTDDGAYIRVYKPNTTNSMFFLMIPGDEELQNQSSTSTPWFLQAKADDEKQTGIDLALDTDGDIFFTNTGDLALSYGLANALQALQLKMVTEQGTLNIHPDFGLVNIVGSIAENRDDLRQTLTTSIIQQVEQDPRFSSVSQIDVLDYTDNNASGFLVQLVVRLAGSGTPIPISFTVNPS